MHIIDARKNGYKHENDGRETYNKVMTIVCKIYLDVDSNGDEVLVTECSTKNFPHNSVQNLPENERRAIYIYPSTMVGISDEAARALKGKIDGDDWMPDIFRADYTFETDNHKNGIGLFGYRPRGSKGETLTKKAFRLKDTLFVDASKLWDLLIDKMPRGDNEFLKNLDITEPYTW